MITTLMIIVFVLGYMAIAFEHPIKVDKAADGSTSCISVLDVALLYLKPTKFPMTTSVLMA